MFDDAGRLVGGKRHYFKSTGGPPFHWLEIESKAFPHLEYRMESRNEKGDHLWKIVAMDGRVASERFVRSGMYLPQPYVIDE